MEARIWKCDVHQDGESLEFMQQVLYITPCLFFSCKVKKWRNHFSIMDYFGEKRSLISEGVFWAFVRLNTFLLGIGYFCTGRAQKLPHCWGLHGANCRKGSTVSLQAFLVASLIIANPWSHLQKQWQPLGLSHMVTAPSCFQQLRVPPSPQPSAPSTASWWKLRKIEHYLFTAITAWNSTMRSMVGHRKNTTEEK